MKLFGAAVSPYVSRVLLAIRWKGLDIPLEDPPGGMKSPEFLAISPYGKVPALDAGDGAVIVESEVIAEYLEDRFPERPLLPADPLGRARSRTVSRAVDLYVLAPMTALFAQTNPATRDQAAAAAKLAELRRGLDGLERLVAGPWAPGPWAVGTGRSLADCALAPTFFYFRTLLPAFGEGDMLSGYPRLAALAARLDADPDAARLMEEMSASLAAFLKRRG